MNDVLQRELLVAWAAGFVDGEGSVVLGTRHYTPPEHAESESLKVGGSNKYFGQMVLTLSASQTDKEPLQRLQGLWGGRLYSGGKQRSEKHAPLWQWVLQNEKALEALTEMEPYLLRKRAQVTVAREFRASIRRSWGSEGMPEEEVDRRLALREAMMILNKRGPKEETPQ